MKNNWISVYLYSDLSFEQVIAVLVKKIVENLTSKGLICSYFFIRYWERGSHIRLRVLTKESKNMPEIKSYIATHATIYYESQKYDQQYRIEFVPYEQEINRYLGKNGIKIAESIFNYSSVTVMNIISKYAFEWSNKLAIAFAIKMHVIFAKSLIKREESIKQLFKGISDNYMIHSVKLDIDNQITQANTERVKAAFAKTFLEQKKKIVLIVSSALQQELEQTESDEWEQSWLQWCQQVNMELYKKQVIPPSQLIQFCENHIHMTNNRLGVHLRDESFIAFMIYSVFSETEI